MQLELFPNDKLTFVMSLSSLQLNALRATDLYTYHMIKEVRDLANKLRSEEQYVERSRAKLQQLVEGLL
jgi:hypothetical protein